MVALWNRADHYIFILFHVCQKQSTCVRFIQVVCVYLANVKTQYQFRSFESGVESSADSELLSVDCQRLTQSVRCLPLHQRLHVDHSLLDVTFLTKLFTARSKLRNWFTAK